MMDAGSMTVAVVERPCRRDGVNGTSRPHASGMALEVGSAGQLKIWDFAEIPCCDWRFQNNLVSFLLVFVAVLVSSQTSRPLR